MTRPNAGWSLPLLACRIALALAWPATATAYCRTSTCTDCPRDPPTGCTIGGKPIAWRNSCVSFSMNRAASEELDLEGDRADGRSVRDLGERALRERG